MHVATAFSKFIWTFLPYPSLHIIFVYKQVICQAKDMFWPEKKRSGWTKKLRQIQDIQNFWLSAFVSLNTPLFILAGQQRSKTLVEIFLQRFHIWLWVAQRMLSFSWIMKHKLVLQLDHRCIVFSRVQGFPRCIEFPRHLKKTAGKAMKQPPTWTACQYKNSQ